MTKIYELLIKYVLKPLLMEGVAKLFKWAGNTWKEFWRKRKLKKKNKKKVKAYEEASTVDESRDTFNDLP